MGVDLRIECDSCEESAVLQGAIDADGDLAWDVAATLTPQGWGLRWITVRGWRASCPRCEAKATGRPAPASGARAGFTLVEVLVVLAIVAFIAAALLTAVVPALRGRAVLSAAQRLQQALKRAQDEAARDGTAKGLRIAPDASWEVVRAAGGSVDPSAALAGAVLTPLAEGPPYAGGLATIDLGPLPAGFVKPPGVLLLEHAPRDRDGRPAEPSSWAWNVRVGDRVRVGGVPRDYWVVGPEADGPAQGNVDRFVNYGPVGPGLDRGDGLGPREFLFLVDGRDGDGDGWTDPGFDLVDQDLDGSIDEADEWTEVERWGPQHAAGATAVPVEVLRRPVPSAGPAVALDAAVVDLTGWRSSPPPRSRAAVDPWTGGVELTVRPDGGVEPSIVASSPASLGLGSAWIHLWVADRGDVVSPPRPSGPAQVVSIHGASGRVVVSEVDPADSDRAIATVEGRPVRYEP